MQNKDTDNQQDKFAELLRQKLENHTLPVDDLAWENIQSALNKQKKRKIVPLWWWYAGSAAAVFLLFFTINGFLKQQPQYDMLAVKTEKKITEMANAQPTPENKIQPNSVAPEKVSILKTNRSLAVNSKANTSRNLSDQPVSEIKESSTDKSVDNSQFADKEKINIANKDKSPTGETQSSQVTNNPKQNLTPAADNNWNDPLKKSKKQGWTVAAAVSSSGSGKADAAQLKSTNQSLKSSIVRAPAFNNDLLASDDFTEKEYDIPLSAGISVAKHLTNRLSIQSGVTYTYLKTRFKNTKYDSDLQLHYLGIPLDLIVYFVKTPKFSMYLAGGGMLEKGIQAEVTKNLYVGEQTVTTTVSDGIDGLQWSVNGALGAAYSIYRGIDFYVEPKISYFFENDQPVSIRTDKKTVLGIEGGIRFNL